MVFLKNKIYVLLFMQEFSETFDSTSYGIFLDCLAEMGFESTI